MLGPLRLDELGAGAAAIGATWLIAAGLESVVSPLAGRFSDRRGRLAPMLAGLVGGAIMFALLPWPNTALVFAIVVIIGHAGDRAAVGAGDGDAVRRRRRVGLEQGLAFGLMNLTWATGQTSATSAARGSARPPATRSPTCCCRRSAWRASRPARALDPPPGHRVSRAPSGKARRMAHTPAQQERKLAGSGGRFVAIGVPLLIVGVVLALLLDHNSVGIGVAIAVLGAIPTVLGIVLMLSAGVQRRDRQGKPWA